jgi:hypothetical protein
MPTIAERIEMIDLFRGELVVATLDAMKTQSTTDFGERVLSAIVESYDAVDDITLHNLAVIDTAMRGALVDLIRVRLVEVGAGSFNYDGAPAFLAEFAPMVDAVRQQRRGLLH